MFFWHLKVAELVFVREIFATKKHSFLMGCDSIRIKNLQLFKPLAKRKKGSGKKSTGNWHDQEVYKVSFWLPKNVDSLKLFVLLKLPNKNRRKCHSARDTFFSPPQTVWETAWKLTSNKGSQSLSKTMAVPWPWGFGWEDNQKIPKRVEVELWKGGVPCQNGNVFDLFLGGTLREWKHDPVVHLQISNDPGRNWKRFCWWT